MNSIRPSAVAGSFYPAEAQQLRTTVRGLLDAASTLAPAPKALIAPHAGYVYSGPIAASVYARLLNAPQSIDQVVLLGPAHRVGFSGIAAPGCDAFATPLGDVAVDSAAIERISSLPGLCELPEAHTQEHSLEVHLPFLQVALGEFRVTPLVVGQARPDDVAAVIDALWSGPQTLIVVSSDLSHYLDYASACSLDERTSRAIVELRGDDIEYEQACGRIPVQGLLSVAGRRRLTATTVDMRNSGDTAGPRDRVVGYGAYAFN